MDKYKVLKAFFKNSEKKNYTISELIELSKEDAHVLIVNDFIEGIEVKEVKPKTKK